MRLNIQKRKKKMKTLYIEPFCGVAGDMLNAALLTLPEAPSIQVLTQALKSMHIHEKWDIEIQKVSRHAISASLFSVNVEKHHNNNKHHQHGRTLDEIIKIIESGSKISDCVKETAKKVFEKLAIAEAKVHGSATDKVHFHEVGAVDAIIDIISCCFIIDYLNIDKIYATKIALGTGSIKSAHGILPVPVPATLNLLKSIPVEHTSISSELATPTGCALLNVLVNKWQENPEGSLQSSSYGAGTRDLKERAAVIRTSIFKSISDENSLQSDEIGVIECNIDDMTPEAMGALQIEILKQGALDCIIYNAQMKKQRPGFLLQILCKTEKILNFANLVLQNTTSLGVRYKVEKRFILTRKKDNISTPYGKAEFKVAYDSKGEFLKFKIESDSCIKLAIANKKSYNSMSELLKKEISKKLTS